MAFPTASIKVLTRVSFSDHHPILVSMNDGCNFSNKSMFRFECAWIAYPFFKDLITESWKNQDDLVNDTTVSP